MPSTRVEPVLDRASHHQNLLPLQTVATPEMAPSTQPAASALICTHQACKPLQATAWSVPPSLTQLVPDPDEAITATTLISLDAARYPPACTMQRITLLCAGNPLIGRKWLASIQPTTDPWRMYGDGRGISQVIPLNQHLHVKSHSAYLNPANGRRSRRSSQRSAGLRDKT